MHARPRSELGRRVFRDDLKFTHENEIKGAVNTDLAERVFSRIARPIYSPNDGWVIIETHKDAINLECSHALPD